MENKQEILDKLLPALQATRRRVMKKYNRKSPRERQLRKGADKNISIFSIEQNQEGCKHVNKDQ